MIWLIWILSMKIIVVKDSAIESKLISKPLFCVNLYKLLNQGMVECLAEKSVDKKRVPTNDNFFSLSRTGFW